MCIYIYSTYYLYIYIYLFIYYFFLNKFKNIKGFEVFRGQNRILRQKISQGTAPEVWKPEFVMKNFKYKFKNCFCLSDHGVKSILKPLNTLKA